MYAGEKKNCHLYSPAAARRQATAATMAAPRPEPSSDNFILILFPGASSSSATLILCLCTYYTIPYSPENKPPPLLDLLSSFTAIISCFPV